MSNAQETTFNECTKGMPRVVEINVNQSWGRHELVWKYRGRGIRLGRSLCVHFNVPIPFHLINHVSGGERLHVFRREIPTFHQRQDM